MKKYLLYTLLAVSPLFVFSCEKQEVVSQEPVEEALGADPWTIVPLTEIQAPEGPVTTIRAGFVETKATLEMNGGGTYAAHSWQAGDQFRMYASTSDNSSFQKQEFYATASGGKVDFSGSTAFSEGFGDAGYWSLAPSSAVKGVGLYSGSYIAFRVTVPQDQEAYAGTPDPDALISVAYSASPEDDLQFSNFVSLIKFRLSGANVSNIQNIVLHCTTAIAGTVPLVFNGENKPEYLKGITFIGDATSRKVTLTPSGGGSFIPDTDYYIAIVPDTHDAFSLQFSLDVGGDSKTITKTSVKSVNFDRSRIKDFGTISVGTDYDDPSAAPTPYMTATAGASKPVTVVVLPEGYTEAEMAQYRLDAKAAVDALFNTQPYKAYASYFNVWILEAASKESGANVTDGHGNITEPHNCFFGSQWGPGYGDMRANDERIFGFVEDNCPDFGTYHTIEEIPVLLIINDTRYGGIAHRWSNGKTYCMAPKCTGTLSWVYATNNIEAIDVTGTTTKPVTYEEREELGEKDGYNSGTWLNIMVHEFGGHSIGRLLDEYWYDTYKSAVPSIAEHSNVPPFGLNISARYDVTPWDELMTTEARTKMTAPEYGRIGVFQGGDVSVFNRWRSEKISCMIDNRFYFSTWQRWIIADRIKTLAGEPALTLDDFLANDDPTDPLRVAVSSVMRAEGVSGLVPPRPVPMLPPPVFHQD